MDIAKRVRLASRLVTRAARRRAENTRSRHRSYGIGTFFVAIPIGVGASGNLLILYCTDGTRKAIWPLFPFLPDKEFKKP